MANNILKATQQLETLNKVFDEHTAAMLKSLNVLERINNEYATLPSGFLNQQKEIVALEKQKTQARIALQREIAATERAVQAETRTRISANREAQSEIRLQESQARQINRINREREREARALRRNQGIYNAVQRRVAALSQQYNELATRKRLFNNLTVREESFLEQLTGTLNRYQGVLKGVDANIGKYQRNVGNYGIAWNGLGNALNQLTREAPAFANSVQTGFLAISNNLPILVDEINRLVAANAQLRAEGQPTTSVLRQIGAALFSWQTLLSVGVTLLTIYGKELFEMARDYFNLGKEINRVAETQEKINKLNEEFGSSARRAGEGASNEAAQLLILRNAAEDVSLSMGKRNEAVDMILKKYPEYFRGIERENILNGEAFEAYEKLNKEIVRRARLTVAQDKLEKLVAIQIENDIKRRVALGRVSEESVNNTLGKIREEANARDSVADKEASAAAERIRNFTKSAKVEEESFNANQKRFKTIEDINAATERQNKEIDEANALVQEEIDALLNLIGALGGYNAEQDKSNKAKNGSIAFFEMQIQKLEEERENLATTGAEYQNYTNRINSLSLALAQLRAQFSGVAAESQGLDFNIEDLEFEINTDTRGSAQEQLLDSVADASERLRKKIENDRKAEARVTAFTAKQQIDTFQTLFDTFGRFYGIDLDKFNFLFDEKKNTTEEYVGAAIAAADFILAATQQNFQAELEAQRRMLDEVLQNENASEEQKRIARNRFDEQERQIRTRQARAERNAALIQVGIDTAAAIVKTLAQTGFVFGSPLIPIIAGIGAAQAAFIAAQPLPTFAEGTENAPEGWAWTQEKGAEPITDKYGRLKTLGTERGATATYLEKGDKVYRNLGEYLGSNTVKESMYKAASSDNEQFKSSDTLLMLDYAFAQIKDDVVKGTKQGVKEGLKGFKNINNINIDNGHSAWKASKGYA